MNVNCTRCSTRYDDAKRWDLCPHATRPMRAFTRLAMAGFFALVALAIPILAQADICQRTIAPDGSSAIACPALAVAPVVTPPAPPVVPVVPVVPVTPTPVDPATPTCAPWIPKNVCDSLTAGHENDGKPVPPGAPSGGSNGTSFEDPTYDFRDGAIRRFVGSGTKSTIATKSTVVSFSIGDSGGNAALTWRITVTVNGRALYEATAGTYQVTTPILVHTGDVVGLTITTVTGGTVIASARLALS